MKYFFALTLFLSFTSAPVFAHHQSQCHADALLASVDEFELYSIKTMPDFPMKEKEDETTFHHYPILGKITVRKGADKDSLVQAFSKAIEGGSGGANCFVPRHGIRLVVEGHVYDFVICFQCVTLYEYNDKGQNRGTCYMGKNSGGAEAFNELLRKAGISIAP